MDKIRDIATRELQRILDESPDASEASRRMVKILMLAIKSEEEWKITTDISEVTGHIVIPTWFQDTWKGTSDMKDKLKKLVQQLRIEERRHPPGQ
jgi:hypothetical protein